MTPVFHQALELARLRVAVVWPQLTAAVYALRGPIYTPNLFALAGGAIAVDQHWRLYVDPEFAERATTAQLATALVHEAWHCLRRHAASMAKADIALRWLLAARVAADCEVNGDMERCTPCLDWPYAVWHPSDLELQPGLPWQDYYLAAKRAVGACTTVKVVCGGSCMDGQQRPWERPDGQGGVDPTEQIVIRRQVAEGISKQAGNVPGGWRRWAEEQLSPTVPWQQLFASALRGAFSVVAGTADYSHQRVSRRQGVTPVLLSALVRLVFTVDVLFDTSGSMGEHEMNEAAAEIAGIAKAAGASVRLYPWDVQLQGIVQQVRSGRQARLNGGGGTDMAAGIAFAEKQRPKANILIVETDGYTPWPETKPRFARVIVGLVGAYPNERAVPSWAYAVRIGGSNR